jgi:hypothetical protein
MNKSSKLGIIEAIELPMSSHNIKFKVLDRHSGIHSIVWVFGIKDSGINIATGDIKVNTDNHLQVSCLFVVVVVVVVLLDKSLILTILCLFISFLLLSTINII